MKVMRLSSKAPFNPFRSKRNELSSTPQLPIPRAKLWICFFIFELFWIRQYYISYHDQAMTGTSSQRSSPSSSVDEPGIPFQNEYITHFSNEPIEIRNQRPSVRTNIEQLPTNPDPNKMDVPEPGYPKETHLVDYQTSASEKEIEKHDRILVQGMHYMRTHDFSPLSDTIANYKHQSKAKDEAPKPKVCLNIYLCNRRIPYINSLLMTLTSFTKSSNEMDLIKLAQVNLLNTEKRPERMEFRYVRETLSKLPFVHKVHDITYRDEIYEQITDRELIFREKFISDEISGLKICIESGLDYCVMMEEDAVVPVDFMTLLHDNVIQPLEEEENIVQVDGSGGISVLSLYSYFNLVYKGANRLHDPRYAKRRYINDVARSNAERYSQGMPPFPRDYEIVEKNYMYGTVAMVYTHASAKKLVEYLQKVGVDPIHNADEFMNADEYFPSVMGIPRKHVQASLVNHIGYYSERMAAFTENGMFSQLNTDARFLFDAGEV